MSSDPAEIARQQRRANLTEAELHARLKKRESRFGRLGRLRSWLTALVGLAAIVACLLLMQHTR
jgi:hypothetical protein